MPPLTASSSTSKKRKSSTSTTTIIDFSKRRKKGNTPRSIWNSTDNWDELIADSSLSTSSISRRRPYPKGLHSLIKCATDAAVRGFKVLWDLEEGGIGWKDWWEGVPDHLKVGVRDGVFSMWGSFLTAQIVHDVFIIPPELYIPGSSLPSLATTTLLKPIHPDIKSLPLIKTLILKDLRNASDIAIAGLIYKLPNLEAINLRGCSQAGTKTVETILKRCKDVKKLNLKGTKSKEDECILLLERYRTQLEAFKVDHVVSTTAESSEDSHPLITHLSVRINSKPHGRNPPHGNNIKSLHPFTAFSSLTHLDLFDVPIAPNTRLSIPKQTLVKLCLGGPKSPAPMEVVAHVLEHQSNSLRRLRLHWRFGEEVVKNRFDLTFMVGERLERYKHLEWFSFDMHGDVPGRAVPDFNYVSTMFEMFSTSPWRKTLRYLHLQVHGGKIPVTMNYDDPCAGYPILEELYLPFNAHISLTDLLDTICLSPNLRILDLSNSQIEEEDVFRILDYCSLLSTIDLTSCRGIPVKNRRNIFRAWRESRGA